MESKDNKYFKWYWSICERAKDRVLESSIYTEKHHIYPKSIYGENDNLVKLTAKEHFIVHLLLWQGFKQKYGTMDERTRKMASAFTMMARVSDGQKRIRIDSNRYEMLKVAKLNATMGVKQSIETIQKRIIKNTGKKRTQLTKDKIGFANKGKIHEDGKCIFMYDKNFNFIKKYHSIYKASIDTGQNYGTIRRCAMGIYKTSGKGQYTWSFKKLNDNDIVLLNENIITHKGSIPVEQYKNNILVDTYPSIKTASIVTNINAVSISYACNGKQITAGGYIWKYKNERL